MKDLRLVAAVAAAGTVTVKLSACYKAALALLISGAIPGLSANIPPSIMLLATITGLWLIILVSVQSWRVRGESRSVPPVLHAADSLPVDMVLYTSRQPSFWLFSPVVRTRR